MSTQPPGASVAQPPDENDGDLTWMRESPFRPPDWRWRLARLSLEEKLPRRPQLRDLWVRRCAKFMRADRVRSRSCRPRRGLSSDHILSEAARIRFASDPLIAAELEAWILTGNHPELIAERCGLTVEAVEAYEVVFFDVRPHLQATSYILHRTIGPPIRYGFALDDLGSLWKFCAYMRGPHALDVLLYVFPGGKPRPWPSTFPATPSEQRALIAACKRMVWTRCLRPADMSPADIVRFLLLNEWFQDVQEADCVKLSGIGAISKVDVTSLVEPRTEDLDSSSPVSAQRGGCTGARGGGTSDRNKQTGAGSTDLDLSGKRVEPAHRVTA